MGGDPGTGWYSGRSHKPPPARGRGSHSLRDVCSRCFLAVNICMHENLHGLDMFPCWKYNLCADVRKHHKIMIRDVLLSQ